MSSEKIIHCGPCSFDDVTKEAGRWCTNCEEGLCEDCEHVHRKSKISRNHRVISIEDYRKIENVSISLICSANSRQSAALFDLQEMIERTLYNVKQRIKNRESATKEMEKQELTVKTMVFESRMIINGHLDRLQDKLLNELTSTSDTCKSKYLKILQKLKSTAEMLTKLREQTLHMKQFSSDIQVFLGTRQFNRLIESEIKSMKDEIGPIKDYELKVENHSIIEKLLNEVEEFGQI
ncbi:unnamed protein product [Mytilus coruscus]|uniref:B box-type domain-containing protein n=1 Tax=Mytilus coruscus TaxID=42192 RepID=A0A6J8DIB1_MYTCO|nr:unnamed protein product [Mytilus coruscus]